MLSMRRGAVRHLPPHFCFCRGGPAQLRVATWWSRPYGLFQVFQAVQGYNNLSSFYKIIFTPSNRAFKESCCFLRISLAKAFCTSPWQVPKKAAWHTSLLRWQWVLVTGWMWPPPAELAPAPSCLLPCCSWHPLRLSNHSPGNTAGKKPRGVNEGFCNP